MIVYYAFDSSSLPILNPNKFYSWLLRLSGVISCASSISKQSYPVSMMLCNWCSFKYSSCDCFVFLIRFTPNILGQLLMHKFNKINTMHLQWILPSTAAYLLLQIPHLHHCRWHFFKILSTPLHHPLCHLIIVVLYHNGWTMKIMPLRHSDL